VYLLVGFIGIAVLYTTTSAKVAHRYILALLLGDIGHLAVTYHGMGRDKFCDITNWNLMAWGNIWATGVLFLARCAYLLGFMGEDREPAKTKTH
jgi:NADH:ubiquinone oxidoreductase subunit 6 (subunit J)